MTRPRFKKLKLALLLIAVLFGASLAVRYYNLYRYHLEKQTAFMMDTFVTLHAVGPKKTTSRAVRLALDRMQELDTKLNHLNPKSPVYAFNQNGTPITDPEVLGLVKAALEVAGASDGAFDITIEPLVETWGFYGKSPHVPDDKDVKTALDAVGYQFLVLGESKLEKKKASVRIDLGGIAKGYIVQEAAKVLKKEGVTSALIDAGGDVYALGKKGSDLWKVGIRNPRGEDLLGYVEVEDLAVMGSGDYERFFEENGKRYHHLFNPKTGYPAEGVIGTTIIHADPVIANAWSKPIFVLGAERGMQLVKRIPGMEAIVVKSSGEVLYTDGLKHALHSIAKNQ